MYRRFWKHSLVLALLLTLGPSVALGVAGEPVIGPGQEKLLGEILGLGVELPGSCRFTGGGADGGVISASYGCAAGDLRLELRHPSRSDEPDRRTSQFAVVVVNGVPPPGFLATLESRVRSYESAFEWTIILPETPTPVPTVPPPPRDPAADAVLGFAALAFLLAAVAAWRVDWRQLFGRLQDDPRAELRRWLSDERPLLAVILALSALGRGWLSIVNRQSNDDHNIVAEMIRAGAWLPPDGAACMECSHPKLFHYTLALVLEWLGPSEARLMAGNLLNFGAGTTLLWLLYRFAREADYPPAVRAMGVAYIAFNAAVVGIFSQTTNDGFVILLASAGWFCLGRYLQRQHLAWATAASLFVVLAALTKASGWIIFLAALLVLAVTAVTATGRRRRQHGIAAVVFAFLFLAVVPFRHPYAENLARRGTPFVNDAFALPAMEQRESRHPIGWFVNDLLTFRFVGLLQVPYDGYGPPPYPAHRTSLWSQLYGRTVFLRFDQGIWANLDPRLLLLGRLALVLGLLPLAALLIGLAQQVTATWRGIASSGPGWLAEHPSWAPLVPIAGLLSALILLVVRYHLHTVLFTWMKAIYLLPAILPLFRFLLDGLAVLWRRQPRVVALWMLAMVLVAIADLSWLIADLSN